MNVGAVGKFPYFGTAPNGICSVIGLLPPLSRISRTSKALLNISMYTEVCLVE